MTDRLTLFLLPYAGGRPALFRRWHDHLPDWIAPVPLALPGRGTRRSAAPITAWSEAVAATLAEALPHAARAPFAIYGHSMGGLLGFELAHALRDALGREPVGLGIGACVAPARRDTELSWLGAPDGTVVAEMRRLGGTPPEVLASADLLAFVLPQIRADFHLCGTYRAPARRSLACPMLVLGATQDPVSFPPERIGDWSRETTGTVTIDTIEGGHFFMEEAPGRTANAVLAFARSVHVGSRAHA